MKIELFEKILEAQNAYLISFKFLLQELVLFSALSLKFYKLSSKSKFLRFFVFEGFFSFIKNHKKVIQKKIK